MNRLRVIGEAVDDGIGRIAGFVNEYVYQDQSGVTVIDSSMSTTAKPIQRAFSNASVPLSDIRTLLLTHQHVDHIRGALEIERLTHPLIACHGADAAAIEGRERLAMPAILRPFMRVRPVKVQRLLADGEMFGPFRVLLVPGHTAGELAFYLPDRKILFSGDSVVERKGRLTLPGRGLASDIRQAVTSLQILRKLEIELLLPGHGVPVRKDISAKLDDLIARAPREFLKAGS